MRGGCLCGAIRFTYDGELGGTLGAVTVCFCAQCRRGQGLAAAVAPILASGFRVLKGADALVEYESSPGKKRAFCGACGAPIYSRRDQRPDLLRLRLGALDEDPKGLRIEAQIFTQSAPEWIKYESAPSYPGPEPGRP
jgi:hypothetical protein